ncbi:MAG: glycosyltransferase family 4 protein [Candidatus Aegiribacteria sp.]
MPEERTEVLLVTPLPPMRTGLATYAERVLKHTSERIRWVVASPPGGEPNSVPGIARHIPLDRLDHSEVPAVRVFQLGNSPHCFPIAQALYSMGGTALFHETVLHHMLRDGYLRRGRMDDYRRELRFCYGPAAEAVEKKLSGTASSSEEYDALLKEYPLVGRSVNSSTSAMCLNDYAAAGISDSYPPGAVMTLGHPLSPLPELRKMEKPFRVCLGMVGSYHPGRNLEQVMRAMEKVREREPDAGLLLIGGGYPDELPPWTVRTGRLEEALYQSWIRTLDLVLDLRHPTCGETSGSLLEAMRAGVPPVVSASGSFLNMPSDAVIRVPPDNMVQGVPAAVNAVLRNDRLREGLSLAARMYAEDTGSVKRLREDWKRAVRMAEEFTRDHAEEGERRSLSPSWVDPPTGFVRELDTPSVTWKFEGRRSLTGPAGACGAYVTAWGKGLVNGEPLPGKAGTNYVPGRELVFTGTGWISYVLWE